MGLAAAVSSRQNGSDLSLAFLYQIQESKAERIKLNSSQSIDCYNGNCSPISGFVASGVVVERSKLCSRFETHLPSGE